MAKYMVLFQIGPVQEFIRAARKTQDYWASSFLLSYLNCQAINAFGKNNVVFPQVTSSSFFDNALKNASFWKRVSGSAAYIPSVPNRFFGIIEGDNLVTQLQNARNAVYESWKKNLAEEVLKTVNNKCNSVIAVNFWNDQINHRALEILYVWREWAEGEDYGAAYRATEALMGARKASRIFPPLAPQTGYACSLCGLRVALGSSQVKTREELRNWWQANIRKKFTYRFREGEYLCAVCTVKRLYPEVVFSRAADVPSTSTMATITWQRELQGLLTHPSLPLENQQNLQKCLNQFREEAKMAAKQLSEPETASLPPYFAHLRIKADQLLEVEGDWLIPSWYQHRERREKTKAALKSLKRLKETVTGLVAKVNEAAPSAPIRVNEPPLYLALITADGDNMGAYLASCTQAEHQEISQRLQTFATVAVPEVIERDRPGFILYWGGDEGLALVSLADLLPALQALHGKWQEVVLNGQPMPTLSAGAVIFHHQYPLRQAMREVFQTLEYAKSLKSYDREKDAWAVKILKRSGAPLLTRAHWHYDHEGTIFRPLELLTNFIDAYHGEKLSPRWLAALQAEERALGDPPASWHPSAQKDWWETAKNLFDHEVKRLLHRQASEDWKRSGGLDQLVSQVQALNQVISGIPPQRNLSRYQDLKGMFHLSHYIAKGGGR